MGVGAYTSALLVTGWGCPFILSILLAGLGAALLGIIVGIPSLRIKGFYLMVATLAFQFVIDYIIIFLAMVLVGGLGRLVGTVFGVIFITLVPVLLDLAVSFIANVYDPNFTMYLGPLKEFVFGGLIILFIILEPEGLVGVWIRIRDYFKIWPLPYVSG
jgi:ABC-type branched-subunit amino acid transport system permease subunit